MEPQVQPVLGPTFGGPVFTLPMLTEIDFACNGRIARGILSPRLRAVGGDLNRTHQAYTVKTAPCR